ncbi:MAG: molybdopterin synthase sulfur carrier subunit [Rhodocyclaceae bacterium]|nr:molybdopterin synthase sulfur carrier subunit [Rhodocyclaceae bacterium]
MIDAPVVSIHIPPALRALADGREEVTASGDTVGEALQALEHVYPALAGRILGRNGQLQPSVDVYLGAVSIRACDGIATPIGGEEVISIVPRTTRVVAGEISVG